MKKQHTKNHVDFSIEKLNRVTQLQRFTMLPAISLFKQICTSQTVICKWEVARKFSDFGFRLEIEERF